MAVDEAGGEGEEAFRAQVTVVKTRDGWLRASHVLNGFALLFPAIAIAGLARSGPNATYLFNLWFFAALLFCVGRYCRERSERIAVGASLVDARASSRGLFVREGPELARETIVSAYVSPSWPHGAYLRVERRDGLPVEMWCPDREGAHRLVRALGLDAKRVAATFRGPSQVRQTAVKVLLAIAAALLGFVAVRYATAVPMYVLFGMIVATFGLAAHDVRYDVGTDGVVVRWLGTRELVPLDTILQVEQIPAAVRLHTKTGVRDLRVATTVSKTGAAIVGLRVGLLAERIRDAMRLAGTLEVDTTPLAREGSSVHDWIDKLRTLARGTGYRAAIQREDLAYVLEDPRKPPLVRVAAAVALGHLDDAERTRLRIAADASSTPEVKEALEAVIDGDDERLAARLARLDDSPT